MPTPEARREENRAFLKILRDLVVVDAVMIGLWLWLVGWPS